MMVCTQNTDTQKNAVILKGLLLFFFSPILEVTEIGKFCMICMITYLFEKPCMYIFAKRFMKLCGHQKLKWSFYCPVF